MYHFPTNYIPTDIATQFDICGKAYQGKQQSKFDSLYHRLCNFIGLMPSATPKMGAKSGPTGSLCCLVGKV